MSHARNARREFLNRLCCIAAGGGAAALIPQLRMLGTALAASSSTASFSDYRALVCVYLQGGNDSWNLLVPFDATRFNTYTTSRSGTYDAVNNNTGLGLALPSTGAQITAQKVVDGNDASASTNQYFLHPSLPELTALFNQQKLAFMVNLGTLVKPITMADYLADAANHPAQLFSHSDQTTQWNQAASVAVGRPGWGGQCAEKLAALGANLSSSPTIPLAISIAGSNRFEIGASSVPYQMSSNGLAALSGVCNPTCSGGANSAGARDTALNNLLAETYASDFAGEYGKVFANARALYAALSPDLPPLSSTYVPTNTWPSANNNPLAAQLKTVATMINLNQSKSYASRQIFFVQLGGFDLHAGFYNAANGHAALLTQVSQALDAFYAAMTSLGLQDNVTLFTASDFARTLQSNGSGSDHAWGSVQMVLGGAVAGGKLYANGGGPIAGFPNQALTAPNNFSRGQIIPGIGVEQYAATLARWMGVTSASDLAAMFPNLAHFSSGNLGFLP